MLVETTPHSSTSRCGACQRRLGGDPGFEQVVVGAGHYQYDPTGSPWTFSGSAGISGNNSQFTAGNPPAPQGSQVAFLQSTGSFTQSVADWAAGSYVLTFDAAQRGNHQASQQNFNVLIDGNVVGTFTPSGTSYESYSTTAFTVTAGTHTVTFQGLDSAGGDNTAFIDDVAVTSSPPSSAGSPRNRSTGAVLSTQMAVKIRIFRRLVFAHPRRGSGASEQ